MATRPIKIVGIIPSSDELILDDNGRTLANASDTILWQIKKNSGVHSIELISPKNSSTNFWSAIPTKKGKNWKGVISSKTVEGDHYTYSIIWKASENGPVRTHDPIISIKPSTKILPVIIKLLISLFSIALGLFTFRTFLKKKDNNK